MSTREGVEVVEAGSLRSSAEVDARAAVGSTKTGAGAADRAVYAMPDLPGLVHGIKSLDPWTVQCDDCLAVFSGSIPIRVVQKAIFNARAGLPGLRLCADCWRVRGWVDDNTRGWQKVGA